MEKLIGKINPKETVHIIGAGASGLILAHYLKKKNIPIKIYEKSRVGGLISTEKRARGIIESAANALFTNDDVVDLLKDLKLEYISGNEKIKRVLVRKSKFLSFPFYFWEIPGILFNFFLKKPPYQKGLSLKQFFQPLLGEKLCDEVASTGLLGIYATDSSVLDQETFFPYYPYSSYREAFKKFTMERKKSREIYKLKKSISFIGGMQDFINALKNELQSDIVLQEMSTIPSNAIICTNAPAASELLEKTLPQVAKLLKQIKYQSIYTETTFTDEVFVPLKQTFGVLFSRKTPLHCYGLLANHEIFAGRTNQGYSYTFIKKAQTNNQLNETEIKKDREFLKFPKVVENKQTTWDIGIPIYSFQRRETIEQIKDYFEKEKIENLAIFGNYVGGISLREIISLARQFSETL
ncbi:MAG: protoporphyrinogen/coproporphyrinogen oxidase [Bacteriovoracaceae bacterium]